MFDSMTALLRSFFFLKKNKVLAPDRKFQWPGVGSLSALGDTCIDNSQRLLASNGRGCRRRLAIFRRGTQP